MNIYIHWFGFTGFERTAEISMHVGVCGSYGVVGRRTRRTRRRILFVFKVTVSACPAGPGPQSHGLAAPRTRSCVTLSKV